jgi:hypothetical protein
MKFLQALGITVAAFAVIAVGFIAAYPLLYPTYSHRYRLTLEVETPDGLKTGSSVIEPSARAQPPILVNTPSVTDLKGDAVFVDLGKGKNLVGLLAVGDGTAQVSGPVYLAIKAFDVPNCGAAFCQWKQISETVSARDLPPKLIPTLVTFSDVNDPKTVRVVQPEKFETVFGPGYHLKRAWIEMTDDPVTRTIAEYLPSCDTPSSTKDFWSALLASGFTSGSSVEPYTLLRRGS